MERLRSFAASIRGAALTASALAAASPASAETEPWHGIWAADPAWCAFADEIGRRDPAPVLFSAEEMRGLETSCRVADVLSDYEFGYYVVTSECAGEGMTWAQVDVLMLGEEGVLWRWMGGGEPIRLTRCRE
jgi:hypothetical protein